MSASGRAPADPKGLDITFSTVDDGLALGALAVVTFPDCRLVDCLTVTRRVAVPYVSGALGFREVDVFRDLIALCRERLPASFPQVFLIDGNGVYHPRRFGSASHLGLLCDVPTIGVAKAGSPV